MYQNGMNGIFITYSNDATIEYSQISGHPLHGIYLNAVDYITVQTNIIGGALYGNSYPYSPPNYASIENLGNQLNGIKVDSSSSNINIQSNDIIQSGLDGIYCLESSSITINVISTFSFLSNNISAKFHWICKF